VDEIVLSERVPQRFSLSFSSSCHPVLFDCAGTDVGVGGPSECPTEHRSGIHSKGRGEEGKEKKRREEKERWTNESHHTVIVTSGHSDFLRRRKSQIRC